MASRFHIEELLTQDASGVVYRAIDPSSGGSSVALRRVLPFGADGPGLTDEQKEIYENAIARLTELRHPALRSVVTGGCDPIDAMPFIATEWVEGEPLSNRLATGPLPQRQVLEILHNTLDVCDFLSRHFTEEAVWINTETSSLIETDAGSLTFAVSPLKLCAAPKDRRSLKAIGQLAEDLMGWRNRLITDQAGGGLAVWLKWLKQNAKTATLAEVRAHLPGATAAATTATPTAPVVPTGKIGNRQTNRPSTAGLTQLAAPTQKASAKKSSKAPLFSLISLILLLGAGGWLFTKGRPVLAKFLPTKISTTAATAAADPGILSEDTAPPVDPAELKKIPEGPFLPNDSSVILQMKGEYVIIRGTLQQVRYSKSGKTLYLEFEKTPPLTYACGFIRKASAPADMTPQTLAPLIGKRVKIRGLVSVEALDKQQRPQILIANRKAIEVEP